MEPVNDDFPHRTAIVWSFPGDISRNAHRIPLQRYQQLKIVEEADYMKGLKQKATGRAVKLDRHKKYQQWLKEIIVETEIKIRKDIEQKIAM